MLFHSQVFLLAFLPVVVVVYYLLATRGSARLWWLLAASLFFYGYWDARLLPLLAGSIVVNWLLALLYRRHRLGLWIVLGVLLNLGLLATFKYANFFVSIGAQLTGWQHHPFNILLPLGISFFTFQQLSYLVDLRRRETPLYGIRDYALYVSFFPQLIAGPIVRHHELVPQFAADPLAPGLAERFVRGLTMLTAGLAKKLFLADPLARVADPIYAAAANGGALGVADAWTAALAFIFQVYLDFSAYSDMAVGLGLMLGFRIPLNFASPLQAASIREFWRRWHMTLTRFVQDYAYKPLGTWLDLSGPAGRAANTIFTMGLIGLWHGAGWTFVLFGLLHGVALAVNQAWSRWGTALPRGLGWLLTFLFVCCSTVVFRSADLATAGRIYAAMVAGGVQGRVPAAEDLALLAVAAAICFLAPNSQTMFLARLRPGLPAAAVTAAALALAVVASGSWVDVPFVYFQF